MGNCCSAGGAGLEGGSPGAAPVGAQAARGRPGRSPAGVANRAVHPAVTAAEGLKLQVQSAKWAANTTDRTPTLVKLTPQHVFVAMFDGLGEQGDVIAAFCHSCVYEVFLECCSAHPGDVSAALKATFVRLDERLAVCNGIPVQARAESGASGVIAHIDLATQLCTVANVGSAHCLLGRIVGSFNAKLPEGFFLSQDHTLRNKAERSRMHKRSLSDPDGDATRVVGGVELVRGVTQLTRALGFGGLKQQGQGKAQTGARHAGSISCAAEVTEHRLTPTDQHLVLGSAGLWDVLGPQDAALRAHFYEKFVSAEAAKAAAAAAAAGQEGGSTPPLSPTARQPNTAEHLVLYGVAKIADRLTRRTCQAEPLSVADMMQLPFERPAPAVAGPAEQSQQQPAAAGGPAAEQAAGSSVGEQQESAGESSTPFIRRELHGDLSAVVVSLRWHNLSLDDQMLRQVLLLAAAQRSAAAHQGEADYARRLAATRWAQIRMLADFHRVYRRTLLRRWWDAAEQVYRSGKIRARGLQERNWNSQGQVKMSPSLKARENTGGAPALMQELSLRLAARGVSQNTPT